jgi:hypothetical protein
MVAAVIPIYPAVAERAAPTRKHPAVRGLIAMARIIAMATTKIAIAVYWRFRYTIAPKCIAAAIFCISSVPVPSFFMLKKEKAAKSNPIMAHTGAIINKSIFSLTLLSKS